MNGKRKILIVFVPAILILLMLLIIAGPFYLNARKQSLRNACLNNLRQLYCPMDCCVPMSKGLTNGAALDPRDVAECIKDGKIPKCPCGPEYEIIWVVGGPPPKCPYHGALLGEIPNRHERFQESRNQERKNVQSEADVIIALALEPYRAKPYAELVKMIDAEPNTIDLKWSCSRAYQVAIWAMWENEPNGNVCVIGMVDAQGDQDSFILHQRSFIKSPANQFVGEQDRAVKKTEIQR